MLLSICFQQIVGIPEPNIRGDISYFDVQNVQSDPLADLYFNSADRMFTVTFEPVSIETCGFELRTVDCNFESI